MKANYFSIILPARRATHYLTHETLPMINSQTYKNFEMIILSENIESFKKQKKLYPWLKVHKLSSRPGEKRDIGAGFAMGNILSFIDDDVYPPATWLSSASDLFNENPQIAAMGGPGIIPPHSGYWEKTCDLVLISGLGSGGYSYRFQKETARFVDDYPSMNLMIRKEVFEKIGGFKNSYWPGEDSKLANSLFQNYGSKIYYHPDLAVYHHRRTNLSSYLKQYKQYGTMRGTFFAHGDKNSRKISYLAPSMFFLYFLSYSVLFVFSRFYENFLNNLFILFSLPLAVYLLLLIFSALKLFISKRQIGSTLGFILVLPLTHLTYGYYFTRGYLKEKLN